MESRNHQDQPRIKYYKPGDLARGYMMQGILSFLEDLNENITFNNINETLEAYNVIRYLEEDFESISKITGKKITQSETKLLYRKVATYISSINSESIDALQQTRYDYIDDLFLLIDRYKLDEKLAIEDIIKLWKKFGVRYEVLFSSARLVKKYGNELRSLLLENLNSAPFLIDYHFRSTPMESVTLPQSLSNEDTLSHIKNYLKQDENNLSIHHLDKIIEARSRYGLLIDDKTKLFAMKCRQNLKKILFSDKEKTANFQWEIARIKIDAQQSDTMSILETNKGIIYSYRPDYINLITQNNEILILDFFLNTLKMQTREGISRMPATQANFDVSNIFSDPGNATYNSDNIFSSYSIIPYCFT